MRKSSASWECSLRLRCSQRYLWVFHRAVEKPVENFILINVIKNIVEWITKLSVIVAESMIMCGGVVVLARHHSKVKSKCASSQSGTKGLDKILPVCSKSCQGALWHFRDWHKALDRPGRMPYTVFMRLRESPIPRNLKISKSWKTEKLRFFKNLEN